MKPEDRRRFLQAVLKIRVSLRSPNLTEEEKALRNEVLWEQLEPYPIDRVERAFSRANGKLKFFPTPAEIIEFIQEDINDEYLRGPRIPQSRRIDWMEPTAEGREKAKQIVQEIRQKLEAKWAAEDREKEKERAARFEMNREHLKKQAKRLGRGQGE